MNRVNAAHEQLSEIDTGRASLLLDRTRTASTPVVESAPPHAGPGELDRLYAGLAVVTEKTHARTARLLGSGRRRVAQKVIEEAGEVALEAVKGRAQGLVRESADLLYHLVVLWRRAQIDPAEVYAEMQRRADALGIAEKLPKAPQRRLRSRR